MKQSKCLLLITIPLRTYNIFCILEFKQKPFCSHKNSKVFHVSQ